ncbi:endo alpha-1,4 polygalactosaminidase [Pseudoalteromonas distincta]|uniref:endo alpha-1,4 polygalactosaminidase n=1 Tax=Pseudoalteromonas distincta TaxID=77608 RepID=UPI0023401C96|nr:endo alpha-1,4 polygalactosaminidase [Pseudoalteromonas distincta]MDC3211356.1 endo alpha-1,4 polygalactosaminidase [Pseudoalteromonas distincta]
MKYILYLALLVSAHAFATPVNNSIAFYYSAPMPLAEMTFYSRVVVQPDLVTEHELNWFKQRDIAVYAYLSVGESFIESESSLAVNPNWNSHIADLTSTHWQQHVQNNAATLKARGFSGLFLDTLDSYQLLDDKHSKSDQQNGLVAIIKSLSDTFNKHLILNRGFELLPRLTGLASDLVAEGLYSHYNPINNSYKLTTENDQAWLSAQLKTAQKLGFKVQVIDYAQPDNRLAMAQKIKQAGFIPWVTDGHLQTWGTSTISPVPRRILIPYNSNVKPLIYTTVHLKLATMIEYLGYIPDYIDMAKRDLPLVDPSLHAGIISWTSSDAFYTPTLNNWLEANLGVVPELILGELPQSTKLLLSLGIESLNTLPEGPYKQDSFAPWLKGESTTPPPIVKPYLLKLSTDATPLITIKSSDDTIVVQAAKTKYGAVVVAPWLIDTFPMEGSKWVIDPRTLLTQAMGLPPILVPDTTTESGRRMLTLHIDGDGFTSVAHYAGKPYSAEVIRDEIIKHYKLPLTSSVIQADIEEGGIHSKQSAKLEGIARSIFNLPYVEVASHTYSHPYFWTALSGQKKIDEDDTDYGFHLDVPGYNTISLNKEITDSIKYINDKLAPKNKKTVMMLWSGDATPGPKALELARDAGVLNVNGGNTDVNADNPSLSHISPIGRPERDLLYQIYAPILNENVYTNLWHGPYYGFRRLTETFEITEKPYRLKPYTIYYHFYSGEVLAGLDALKHNIDYVLARPNTPVHLSHYAKVAKDFYFSALAKNSNNEWLFSSKYIRTLRIPSDFDVPNIAQSEGVSGVTEKGDYIHIINNIARLSFDHSQNSKKPYLASANVVIDNWQVNGPVSFKAWVPASLDLINARSCEFVSNLGERFKGINRGKLTHFKIPTGDFYGYLNCNESAL